MAAQIQTSPSGMTYSGNQDFRGYLAANAPQYLDFVGKGATNNDYTSFGVNQGALNQYASKNGTDAGTVNQNVQALYDQYNSYGKGGSMGASGGGTSTGVTGTVSPTGLDTTATNQLIQGIKGSYDTSIASYQNQLQNTLPQNYTTDVANLQNYSNAQSKLNSDTTQGQLNTFGQQQANTTASQNLSLAQLADSIRSQNQGFQNQLGIAGAGSSSAVGMGEYALGRQKAMGQSSINLNAAENNAVIQQQINAAIAQGQDVQGVLKAQTSQSLQSLTEQYQQNVANLNNQLAQASGSEARDLIYYTKKQLDTTTLAQLNNLNSNVSNYNQIYNDTVAKGQATGANVNYAAPTGPQKSIGLPQPNFNPSQGLSSMFNR